MLDAVSHIDLQLSDDAWPFEQERQAEIASHWAARLAEKPAMFDGRVLGTYEPRLDNGVFSGRLIETSFSAFLAWRDWGFPDTDYFNLFGSAVIASNDGAYLFGIMGAHTSNAGMIYPCGGSLEPADVGPDGLVDLWGSTAREMREETGLNAAEATLAGDFIITTGQLLSASRIYRFDLPAETLVRRIEADLETQEDRELDGIAVLRHLSDLDQGRSPRYAIELLGHLLGAA